MNNSKKTCYLFTQNFPYGESEVFIEGEIKFLSEYFEEVVIFPSEKPSGKFETKKMPSNVKTVYLFENHFKNYNSLNSLKQNLFLFAKVMFNELMHNPILSIKQFRNLSVDFLQQAYRADILKNYLNDIPYDNVVFYSYWFDRWAIILSIIKEDKNYKTLKFVSRAHGFEIFKDQTQFGYHPFKRFMLAGVKKVYAVSQMGMHYLKKSYSGYKKKIEFSYLGFQNSSLNQMNGDVFHIVSCAHVSEIKRLDLVCDILANVKADFKIKWTLIGGGEGLGMIKRKAEQLPPNITCCFTGSLSSKEVFKYYEENPVNLFLSLSRSEGLPFSMIEAISFGIPILSTDVGGCKEIVTNQTGILIEKDFKAIAVAKQIEDFIGSDKNTEQFRIGVRIFWENNFNAEDNYKVFCSQISAN
ncbi:glycosyltransferase [Aurantibacillus circumpalustris]|uniref:glycosyltransferase n=1 Tax=Aurantibacillus circumpalustris TaxID=3036359 RepID=UPI00295BC46E|nr:glycosyltransferase [Aurantibacillus circumpalustris]